jgi:MurNAc alpha-1-phosphate uridylyltransferase
MVVKNDIGVIDSQDALIGNKAYDLASLIDDVRFQTSVALKKKIYNFYLKTQKKLNKKYFKNDFEIISVLRNLKIIGIFTRLAVRDNKKKYLKLIPYAWKLIKLRSQNDNFKDLNNLLKVLKKINENKYCFNIMCRVWQKVKSNYFKNSKASFKNKNLTLLEHCINLIKQVGVKKIFINSFYLKEQINKFIEENNFEIEIKVIEDGNTILNTGGGVLNLISKINEDNYLVFNPDTIWNNNYLIEIENMIELYFKKDLKNLLLLVDKKLSFDKNLKGDFNLNKNLITQDHKNYIYTGCQILNESIFKDKLISNFSISEIWLNLIKNNQLYGFESKLKFYHATDLETFNKLQDL